MVSRACAVSILSLAMLVAPAPARAQDTGDRQVWLQALAVGRLSENWRSHVEVQPRFFDDASELGLTLVRTAIGRRITPRLTLWAGHAWVPRTLGVGVRHEQRVWEQVSLALPVAAGWTPTARLRLEQRWLQPWDGTSHRVRTMGRVQRALGSGSAWQVAAYDELMVTLGDTGQGPERGFDRNRLYGGVMRQVGPVVTLEAGYLWEHSRLAEGVSRNDHALVGVVTLQLPR